MIEWIRNNWIEITGAIFALIYLILEVRQKWTMWIIGVISSSFYVYIFFQAKLYAETGMNIYYVLMSVYGLYCWKFVKTENDQEIKMKNISRILILKLCLIAFFLLGMMSYILVNHTDSPVPYPDALVAVLSIIATWMVTQKIIEHWYIWIFTNFFCIGLYAYQQLYPTSALFVVYSIMSIVGLVEWRKTMRNEHLK